jgi:hypothetical protein
MQDGEYQSFEKMQECVGGKRVLESGPCNFLTEDENEFESEIAIAIESNRVRAIEPPSHRAIELSSHRVTESSSQSVPSVPK